MVDAASTVRVKLLRDPLHIILENVARKVHITLFNWC